MLLELSIRNFAIIDDISATFNDGLSVLTGETGAGKSIIIDAMQLLAGGRGSVEYVRYGEEKAEIIGLFSIDKNDHPVFEKCDYYDIETEDNMLTLERTITSKGKSVCRINGKIVTLTILRKFGQTLLNIHSQHDTMHLMDEATHITLLDQYDVNKLASLKKEYKNSYTKLVELQTKYDALNQNEQEMAHRVDLLSFQIDEINGANLQLGEDDALNESRMQLQNYEKIYHSIQGAYYALYGEQKGLEWATVAKTALQQSATYDEQIETMSTEMTNAYFSIEELTNTLRIYLDELHFDEDKLNQIESRLDEINRLCKKYGQNVDEILQYRDRIEKELDEIQNKDTHIEQLAAEIDQTYKNAFQVAKQLQKARRTIAKHLENNIKQELANLHLENASFKVQFTEMEHLNETGIDKIVFLISTNIGEPLKEMQKVASGGELSRIMLALKKIFAKHDQIETVIFDEIDTGVSGRVAQSIAEKMYDISLTTQVLSVTHLPQVAAMADQHILINKHEVNERTATQMTKISGDEKVKALAEMLTGTTLTESALEHAEQLLTLSTEFKEELK